MPKITIQKKRKKILKNIFALRAQGFTLDEVGERLNIGKPGSHKQAVKYYLKDTSGCCRCCQRPLEKCKEV